MYKRATRYLQHLANKPTIEKKPKYDKQGVPEKVQAAFDSHKVVKGMFSAEIKGGFSFLMHGFRAFCPYSEMYPRNLTATDLAALGPTPLEFEIIKIDLSRKSVVISRKRAIQRRTWKKVREAYEKGSVVPGSVKSLVPYGAFVDLGGIDGLLHTSEMSDGFTANPAASLKIGQTVKVTVVAIEKSNGNITLSMRRRPEDKKEAFPKPQQKKGRFVLAFDRSNRRRFKE